MERTTAIEGRAIDDAWSFIDRFCASDERDRVLQVACLHLLLQQGSRNSDWWVQTDTLRSHLEKAFGEEIGEHKLRHLIGGLRDAGVLVASKIAGGYKLATCERDIVCFLERQNSQLGPMINRVQKAREIVKRATDAQLDILSYKEYRQLKAAVNAVERLVGEKGS